MHREKWTVCEVAVQNFLMDEGARISHGVRSQRSVDVAASLKPTVAALAERSRASFQIGHGQKPRVGGHWVVHFPGATILGCETVYLFRGPQPSLARSHRMVHNFQVHPGQCTRWQTQYVQTGSVFFSVLVRRCGVLVASCCGIGSPHRLDVAASMAYCCGSSNSRLFSRCGVPCLRPHGSHSHRALSLMTCSVPVAHEWRG